MFIPRFFHYNSTLYTQDVILYALKSFVTVSKIWDAFCNNKRLFLIFIIYLFIVKRLDLFFVFFSSLLLNQI